jgi:hypothetical protein
MSRELFEAIAARDLDRLAALLAAGAPVDAVDPAWSHYSAMEAVIDVLDDGGPIDALVLLLRHGAPVNAWDEQHASTPLLMAVFRNQPEAVRLLLAAGAETNVVGDEGDSPLRWCAERGWHELAALLLRSGAGASIDEGRGFTGMHALGWAAHRLDVEMVRLLLAHGARPDALDMDYFTAERRMPEPTDPEERERWTRIRALLQPETE